MVSNHFVYGIAIGFLGFLVFKIWNELLTVRILLEDILNATVREKRKI